MQQVDEYRLERLIGEGATGTVFAATGRSGRVALKLLRPEYGPDSVVRARFLREARLGRRVSAPHVTPILDFGEADGMTYFVMPLASGGSLADRLRVRGSLGPAETVALAAQLGRGLDALHDQGVLHRDVKPSNVLLDDDGSAALTDFGLARATDSTRVTGEGQLVGSLHYLAPELIEGSDATRASDIYALGCLLYECVAGEPPFAGRSAAEIAFAHLTEPPRADAAGELAQAVLVALEKDPAMRPTTGTALARMLDLARTAPQP